jgi:uncharacterized protein
LPDTPDEEEQGGSQRTCIATREVRSPDEMLRFVRGPDGAVVPDLRRRLPGRGVWVTASADAVALAVKRKAFGRSLRAEVRVDQALPALVDRLLAEAALQSLAMANKAGRVVCGFSKVEAALRGREMAALIHASDAAEDGKRKLAPRRSDAGRPDAAPIIELFNSEQLSLALGRPHVIHAALLSGPVSAAFLDRSGALARYRGPSRAPAAGSATDGHDELDPAKAEGMDAE